MISSHWMFYTPGDILFSECVLLFPLRPEVHHTSFRVLFGLSLSAIEMHMGGIRSRKYRSSPSSALLIVSSKLPVFVIYEYYS